MAEFGQLVMAQTMQSAATIKSNLFIVPNSNEAGKVLF
jgi:hypothetical protein